MAAIFKALYDAFTVSVLTNMGGIRSWLAKMALKYGGQYLYDILLKWEKDLARAKAQEEEKKKFEEVIKKPNSSVEERAKAYEDYINSNR